MKKLHILSLPATLLFAAAAVAQDGTETCAAPTAVAEGAFAFDTTPMMGTNEMGEGLCGNTGTLDFFQDMFWVYTATAAGTVTFDTIGSSFDTQLAVYSGVDCSATCVDQDDDSGGSLTSELSVLNVLAGDTFVVQVGGYISASTGGKFGPGTLNISVVTPPMPPANDDCGTATALTGTGAFAFDATAATDSTMEGDGACGVTYVFQDVFFSWTAPADGMFTFNTEHQSVAYDTKMVVYSGSTCGPTAPCLDSNDDIGGGNFGSTLTVTATMGDAYLIQISSFSAFTTVGPNVLTITQAPDGSDCDLGLPISGAGAFAYDTTGNVSTGFDGGGSCASGASSVNQDMFYVWTADADGDWQIDTELTGYDTKLSVHTGSDCMATCFDYNDDGGQGLTSLILLTGLTTGDTFLIQVGGFGAGEGPGTLTIAPAVDPCDPANEDAFEDNDTCATAAVLTAGVHMNLFATDADTDWYTMNVPAGEILTVTLSNSDGDIDFNVLEGDCMTVLGSVEGSWSFTNSGAVAMDVTFEAFNDSVGGGPCSIYDLDITVAPDPCDPINDDTLEDNDDCATALAMVDGTTTGLFVSADDGDFYAFCVADGATVTVDMLFDNSISDLDIFLRAATSPECGSEHNGGIDLLAEGWSASDDETLTWTNATGADLDVILQVDNFQPTGCNNYDLTIAGSGGCGPDLVGTAFCDPMDVNSTGMSTMLTGTMGSGVGSGLNLQATQGPPNRLGYMLVGTGSSDPGLVVSEGRFCLAIGPHDLFGRYNQSGADTNSVGLFDASGVLQNFAGTATSSGGAGFDVPLDVPNIGSMIAPGQTWHFQLWHRDQSGASNFSNGLSVTF